MLGADVLSPTGSGTRARVGGLFLLFMLSVQPPVSISISCLLLDFAKLIPVLLLLLLSFFNISVSSNVNIVGEEDLPLLPRPREGTRLVPDCLLLLSLPCCPLSISSLVVTLQLPRLLAFD